MAAYINLYPVLKPGTKVKRHKSSRMQSSFTFKRSVLRDTDVAYHWGWWTTVTSQYEVS